MFKDVELSRDVMQSFKESSHARSIRSDVELSVHVLTQGYWPTYPPVEVNLPQEVLHLQEIFNNYYTSKHNGRRLQWHPYLGHCTLKANFPLGRKELVVSLLQTIVLVLFNDSERLSYSDILSATAIEDKELKVTLQSLACAKQRVLRKEPKGRDVAEDDVFYFDSSFKHQVQCASTDRRGAHHAVRMSQGPPALACSPEPRVRSTTEPDSRPRRVLCTVIPYQD